MLTVNSDFVIDMGTYEPEVNNMLVTKVTKRPACHPGTKLVFGIKVGLYGRPLSGPPEQTAELLIVFFERRRHDLSTSPLNPCKVDSTE